MPKLCRLFLLLLSVAMLTLPARAVIVAGGDGTQNTTPPPDDFGFANVGAVFNVARGFFNSGVYLGNGWVLTAYHVIDNGLGGFQFGSIVFDGISYTAEDGSAVRLSNPGLGPTDLAVFKLTTVPENLAPVKLSLTTPLLGASVSMAGDSINRMPNETHWNVVNSVWTETNGPGTRQGYKWADGGQTVRWGTNAVSRTALLENDGFGEIVAFRTVLSAGISGEAQGAAGDSGGGVFVKNAGQWELAGIMVATSAFAGQPGRTAVFGNETLIADISTYRNQILAVPEPGCGVLLLIGAAALAVRRQRRHSEREQQTR